MSSFPSLAATAAAVCAALWAIPTSAHVTLVNKEAEIGSRYVAVLRVPHGCKGAATVKLRVRVPEGVLDVQPRQAPSGWTVDTVQAPYSRSYTLNDKRLDVGVTEVIWSGGPLPDKERAEFAFSAYLDPGLAPDTALHFPTVQECVDGSTARWIDIPPPGSQPAADHADTPAPAVKLKAGQP